MKMTNMAHALMSLKLNRRVAINELAQDTVPKTKEVKDFVVSLQQEFDACF
jgi:hypothetical protein